MSRVLVTRPEPEASAWARALSEAGHQAVACPLIDIVGLPLPATQPLPAAQALMFVSPQAVTAWWAQGQAVQPGQRCWAPGPGTARALRERGVAAAQIDQPAAHAPQFDSETLWAVVQPQVGPGHCLLIVRGDSADAPASEGVGHGREWLRQHCLAAGGQVASVAVYRRQPPHWSAAQREQALRAAHDGSRWLISSSEALVHLQQLCPHHDWSAARALVTHPRIAQTAQNMGFGEIITTRPALPDVLQALSHAP